ncbi:MAG: hypothetical protein ABIO79_04690 [Ferruginibacter sp.]
MKLRIKGNSLRIRLTKSEVSTLANTGYLEEEIVFPGNTFMYALQRIDDASELSATFNNNKITMLVPASFVKDWPENEVVGINTNMPLADNAHPDDPVGRESLYLLVEKDFVCLDETTEDQSDNFENPNKTC